MIEYPVAFKIGTSYLVGVRARKFIGPSEAYLFIPSKLVLNKAKALKSEIRDMILENESLLDEIGLSDPDRLILTFFVAFEIGKGARSFWNPYFETTENTDLP